MVWRTSDAATSYAKRAEYMTSSGLSSLLFAGIMTQTPPYSAMEEQVSVFSGLIFKLLVSPGEVCGVNVEEFEAPLADLPTSEIPKP